MAKSMKKMLLLAAIQLSAGVDAAPVAATNAILCRALMPEPISGEQVERNLIRPYKGNSGKLFVGEHRKLTCEVELAGSGTPGDVPAWGPLLRACGFAETITVGTDVVYEPVSGGEPLLTLYSYLDGTKFVMVDCKGTVSFELNAKGIPIMKFEFIGTYTVATEGAMPTGVDYSMFVQPKTVGKTNTPTFTFHGLAACTSAFTITWGNTLEWRELINCASTHSADRKPTGNITMELPTVTTKNWAEVVRLNTVGAASLVHGTLAGNIVELDLPQIQCGIFTLQDDQSVAMMSMPFDLMPLDGDDELRIIVR
ncbi:phage tail tube protein [Acidovorax sp. LjRoot118]|uniref:phage tail tube protein n=1 Tax=Acidovorax sp. LjRoot118 TaxID=3342256 RepID=UPI003ECE9BD4